ncbi:MAG: hypothetical protein NTAFB01_14980 [Nitrospira sp.]
MEDEQVTTHEVVFDKTYEWLGGEFFDINAGSCLWKISGTCSREQRLKNFWDMKEFQ